MTDQEDDDYEERYWVAALRAPAEYGLSIQERLLLALIDAHPTVAPDASEDRKQEAREDRLRKAMQIVFGHPKRDGRDSSLRPNDNIARGWMSYRWCPCGTMATLAVGRLRKSPGNREGIARWLCQECFDADRDAGE